MLDARNPYTRRYASLSITDLLDAREASHVHLTQIENVFATATGLYRILRPTYEDKTFLPSLHLANLAKSDFKP